MNKFRDIVMDKRALEDAIRAVASIGNGLILLHSIVRR